MSVCVESALSGGLRSGAVKMAEGTTSEVSAPVYKTSHTFKIRNFDKLIKLGKKGESIESAEFGHPDTPQVKWRVDVIPESDAEKNAGFVSVFLHLRCKSEVSTIFSISSGKTKRSTAMTIATGLGWPEFVAHKSVEYSEQGVFEVTAEVEYVWGKPMPATLTKSGSQPVPPPKAADHSSLLFSKELSDFALVVGGQTIPVHKVLLASASPVFRAMFAQKGTREAATNSAVLKETSVGAVKCLLRFVYTGRLEGQAEEGTDEGKVSSGEPATMELCGLLALAGRYDVAGLGEAAEEVLRGRVDKGYLPHIATAADLHDFPELFDLCRDAVLSGRVELSKWLLRQKPVLFAKLTAHAHLLP